MAKEIKSFKLKDLKITVPKDGQWENMTYDYSPVKSSLKEKGYKPEECNYICADVDGNVMYGARRVWLMQNDMDMDQETDIDCEIMTKKELFDDLCSRMNADMKGRRTLKDKKTGKMIPAIERPAAFKSNSMNKKTALRDFHKKKANITGYPYDFETKDAEGKTVKIDAGKS